MVEVIDSLLEDHVNMTRLLDALEHQLAVFDRAERPDYDVIQGVIDYCLAYPDAYHHPKEDAIFQKLRSLGQEPGAIGSLDQEHAALASLTAHFAEVVGAVLQEAEVPREGFEETARQFIDAYRKHMAAEERRFFPAAQKHLTSADWAEVEAAVLQTSDPLFGAHGEARFAALRERVLAWDKEREALL